MAERIRWEEGAYGTNQLGYVGTRDEWLFQIFKPSDAAEDYELVLMSTLPDAYGRRVPSSDIKVLKATAERWLAAFAASIGAVFPEPVTTGEEPHG